MRNKVIIGSAILFGSVIAGLTGCESSGENIQYTAIGASDAVGADPVMDGYVFKSYWTTLFPLTRSD